MENLRSSRPINSGIEENTLAILDSSGIKEARDLHDDRLAFLEAVRAASLVSDSGTAPTSKMYEAIFHILKDSTLELTMMSYQLLIELDKHFPRVSCRGTSELVVLEEAWSPFSLSPTNACSETDESYRNSGNPLDSLGFLHLTESIAQEFDKVNGQVPGMKLVGDMMLFQYLVNVLEHDFSSRNTIYKETTNWSLFRESILNMLLASRRINYKGFMKDCVSILSKEYYHQAGVTLNTLESAEGSPGKAVHSCDVAVYTSYFELKKGTYRSMQKFLSLIMELDIIKKQADIQGQTSRADGVRTPLLEIILDELTYDEELFSRFLQVFSNSKWKLEIILQYFSKYITKPSVRTRRSNVSSENTTLDGVLSCFLNDSSTKSIIRKISTDVAQLLLGHAFQAVLDLRRRNEHITGSREIITGDSVVQICKDIIAAFDSLRRADKSMEILPIGKQALFTASTIVSFKS